jgi:hypothetical protein
MDEPTGPELDLRSILSDGFWRFKASEVPALTGLASRTFGDAPTTQALRSRLRHAFVALGLTHEEAARRLYGVTSQAAGLNLGDRQRLAGESADLPKTQAPSTVRAAGGLQDLIVSRLVDYFETGLPADAPTPREDSGKGYYSAGYEVLYSRPDPLNPILWRSEVRLTVRAYMNDISLVEGTIHRRGSHSLEGPEVTSPGHHLVGTVPMRPSQAHSPQRIVIYLETPLNRNDDTTITFWHDFCWDRDDPIDSYGVNTADYPALIALQVSLSRSEAPEYSRLQQIDQPAGRYTKHEQRVVRVDDSPMEYHIPAAEPHTRYAIKWRFSSEAFANISRKLSEDG